MWVGLLPVEAGSTAAGCSNAAANCRQGAPALEARAGAGPAGGRRGAESRAAGWQMGWWPAGAQSGRDDRGGGRAIGDRRGRWQELKEVETAGRRASHRRPARPLAAPNPRALGWQGRARGKNNSDEWIFVLAEERIIVIQSLYRLPKPRNCSSSSKFFQWVVGLVSSGEWILRFLKSCMARVLIGVYFSLSCLVRSSSLSWQLTIVRTNLTFHVLFLKGRFMSNSLSFVLSNTEYGTLF
jgi:hypothetical protein